MDTIKSTIENSNEDLELMQRRLDVLKRIKFLQKCLIDISFKSDSDRSEMYASLLGSLKLARTSLSNINNLYQE